MSPIKIDPKIMGGKPCFAGTSVPTDFLFDSFKQNRTLIDFLQEFPTVTREQAIAVLKLALDRTIAHVQKQVEAKALPVQAEP